MIKYGERAAPLSKQLEGIMVPEVLRHHDDLLKAARSLRAANLITSNQLCGIISKVRAQVERDMLNPACRLLK